MEERICWLLRHELLIQKKLDKDIDAAGTATEGLQTINVYDLEVIEHYYASDHGL